MGHPYPGDRIDRRIRPRRRLITRELGGGRAAQALCAWAYAFAATPLLFGHVMLTSSIDLVVWPLVTLMVIRAVLRADPRWWLAPCAQAAAEDVA